MNSFALAKADQEKISFITSNGTFCFIAMPFKFKDVGETCQRLMDKVCSQHIGRNIEVYMNDILVKSS